MTDIIRSGANLCLEFRDALTNRMIEAERVEVWFEREHISFISNKLLKKHRFLLLWGIEQGWMEIVARAESYEEKRCKVFIGKDGVQKEDGVTIADYVYTDAGMPVLALCLYPAAHYPLPEDYSRKCIQGEPSRLIRTEIDAGHPLVLMEDYQGGEIIRFHAGEKVVGGLYRIKGRDGQFEDFVAVVWREKAQKILGAGLSGHYPRGSRLYFLYETVAGESGDAVVICRERRN